MSSKYVRYFIQALLETLHPKKGNGYMESILLIVIIIVTGVFAYLGVIEPDFLQTIIYSVVGFLIGKNYELIKQKNGKNNKSNGEKRHGKFTKRTHKVDW